MSKGGDYVIQDVAHDELHSSPYQPVGRVEASAPLNRLKASIKEDRLQYPPLVVRRPQGDGYTIVDGHRRIAAMRALGWPKIPVIIAEGVASKLFSAVSGTTKPLKAADWIGIFLAGGEPPSGATRSSIKKLDEVMGRDFLIKLSEAGLSPQIWSIANRMVRYLELNNDRLVQVLEWLYEHRASRQVSSWITGDNPKNELLAAFQQNRTPSLGSPRQMAA